MFAVASVRPRWSARGNPRSSGARRVRKRLAEPVRKMRLCDAVRRSAGLLHATDHLIDGDDRQIVGPGQVQQFVAGRHVLAVATADFAQHSCRHEPGEPHQVDGGLGMPLALEESAFARDQGKDVSRAAEVLGTRGFIDDLADREGALLRADSGLAQRVVEGDCKAGRIRTSASDHRFEAEATGNLGHDGHAELPTPLRNHEMHLLTGDLFRSHQEVGLVFAVLGIGNDDHPPLRQGGQRVFQLRVEGHGGGLFLENSEFADSAMRNQRGLIADRNEDARHDRVGVAIVSKRTAVSGDGEKNGI
jgi:hypothetical protein